MNDHELVSWRKPVILAICALLLGLLLAGRAFLGETPSEEMAIEAHQD